MAYIQTNKPGIIRDTHSKAILFVDQAAAKKEFNERSEEKMKIQSEINTLKVNMEQMQTSLKQEIGELKEIILNAISGKGNI